MSLEIRKYVNSCLENPKNTEKLKVEFKENTKESEENDLSCTIQDYLDELEGFKKSQGKRKSWKPPYEMFPGIEVRNTEEYEKLRNSLLELRRHIRAQPQSNPASRSPADLYYNPDSRNEI